MASSIRASKLRAFRAHASRTVGSRRVSRNRLAVTAGLFDFLKASPAASKQNPRARELVDELLELCVPTDAGLKVTPAARERIEELAEELQQYCIRNPAKSPLLWGEYEVVYTGNPMAIAGPFRQGAGMAIFPGQKVKQILQAPNVFINDLQYKTLGFLDGFARQFGEIEFTSSSTFKVTLQRQELSTGVGPAQKKDITAYRNFEVTYLDDDVRVTRFLPVEGLRDDERDAGGQQRPPAPPTLFVFKRVKVEAEVDAEVDGGTSSSEEAAAGTVLAGLRLAGTDLLRPKRLEGAATLTERQVRRRMEEDNRRGRGGTGQTTPLRGRGGTGGTRPTPSGTGGTRPATPEPRQKGAVAADKKKQQEADAKKKQQEAARAAADKQRQEREAAAGRERQAKEAAAEKERKAREAAAEKERREAEAAAAREKQAAIRNLLAQLSQELKDKAAARKDALVDLKAVERGNTNVLRAAAAARSKVEAAAASSASAAEALEAAKQAQQEAAQQLRECEGQLKEVQKGTQKVLAGTARTSR